jgi:hypothetical protein
MGEAPRWRVEHGLRQDQAVGRDHRGIQRQRGEIRLCRRIVT